MSKIFSMTAGGLVRKARSALAAIQREISHAQREPGIWMQQAHKREKNFYSTSIEEPGIRARALFSKLSMFFWLQIRGLPVHYLVIAA
jgi:hypothetical protein